MSSDWPGVTVVMPVLNEERHLEAAVSGVLTQEYPGELEVVLVVGPSRDATRAIADRLAAIDPRVRVVDNPAARTPIDGSVSTVSPVVEDSTMNSCGLPSSSAPTMNSSASTPRGTPDLVPVRRKPSPLRSAFVAGASGSKRAVGSASASAAAGTSSPVKAGR